MSNRRMFSNRIANSARFLQMPTEAQLLYFHMILRADDDGVVESYPLMRLLGVPNDNLKLLLVKEFIRKLNDDQVIVIVDWLEHNTIRADRKVDSIYKKLLIEKAPDIPTIEPKERSDVKDNSKRVRGQSTVGISQVKLSKDKLIHTSDVPSQDIVSVIDSFKEVNQAYKKWYGNITQRNAVERLIENQTLEKVLRVIKLLVQTNMIPYMPSITTPIQLEDKWSQLESALIRKKQEIQTKSSNVV